MSTGCILYELLTGDILFDPEKDKNYSRDIHHLYWIEQLLGNIPKEMIIKSQRRNELFDKNNKIRNINKVDKYELEELIKEKCEEDNKEELLLMLDLLKKLLKIDPKERINVKDSLNHKCFNELKKRN